MKKFYEKVLEKNTVPEKEFGALLGKVRSVTGKLSSGLKRKGIRADIMLGGSAAKGTMIKGDFDFDIFVRFDRGYAEANISDMLGDALKQFEGMDRVHGSRDYFQLMYEGVMLEFVPVIRIENADEAINVTDVSPLHVGWISRKIENNPGLRDEIILAKLFCKANGLYGAESYISGFSGHVIDILVSYYGSFESLLENSVSWQQNKVIDIEGHGSADNINESKLSPVIVIDPIQKERNAAAALNGEKFAAFKRAASEFLKRPSESFFTVHNVTEKELKENARGKKLIILKVEAGNGKRDVLGSRMLKVFNHIKASLEGNEFEILSSGWDWSKKKDTRMWFILPDEPLSDIKVFVGPPLKTGMHAERFREAHKDAYEKNGRLFADVKREYKEPKALVSHLIGEKFVKERVKSIRIK